MKKLFAFFLLSLCLTVHSQETPAAGQAGLTYEVYQGTGAQPSISPLAYPTVVKTGVSPTINYSGAWGGTTTVLDSGYWDRFIVRWTGYINVPTTGTYTFGATADDGVILRVNNTEIISGWYDSGGALRTATSITLTAGTPVPIEIWYYENGGGQAISFYYLNNGSWTLVPSTMLATSSDYWAPAPAATAVYGNYAITTQQLTKKTQSLASNPTGHNAIVEVAGDDNLITIQQIGSNGHFASVSVNGNINNIDILQTTTGTDRHYLESTVTGSNNNLILQQRDTSKTQFISVNGNSNTITTNQKDTGNHFLDLSISGNNHTAGIIQEGSGNHNARVVLDGTQPWNFQLNQSGSTSKNYNLPHSMSDGSSVSGTCSAIGGCSLIVNQQ